MLYRFDDYELDTDRFELRKDDVLQEIESQVFEVLAFLFGYVWVRASLPRYRYDQLMDIGWKRLIPLALGWLLLIAAIRIGRNEDWNIPFVVAGGVVAGLACWGLLAVAMRVGAHRREFAEEGIV